MNKNIIYLDDCTVAVIDEKGNIVKRTSDNNIEEIVGNEEELIEEARWVDSYENEEKYAKINIKIIDNIENLKDLILSTFQEIISYASNFDSIYQESDYVENYLYSNSDMEVVILENEVKPMQY